MEPTAEELLFLEIRRKELLAKEKKEAEKMQEATERAKQRVQDKIAKHLQKDVQQFKATEDFFVNGFAQAGWKMQTKEELCKETEYGRKGGELIALYTETYTHRVSSIVLLEPTAVVELAGIIKYRVEVREHFTGHAMINEGYKMFVRGEGIDPLAYANKAISKPSTILAKIAQINAINAAAQEKAIKAESARQQVLSHMKMLYPTAVITIIKDPVYPTTWSNGRRRIEKMRYQYILDIILQNGIHTQWNISDTGTLTYLNCRFPKTTYSLLTQLSQITFEE